MDIAPPQIYPDAALAFFQTEYPGNCQPDVTQKLVKQTGRDKEANEVKKQKEGKHA